MNQTYKILSVSGDRVIAERLHEFGFMPGETVKVLYKSPFGEPIVVQVRDTSVALRKRELECLQLQK